MSFAVINYNGLELLVYEPWFSAGIVHGMTTTAHDFSRATLGETWKPFASCLDVTELAIPEQCHGVDVLDMRTRAATEKMLERAPDLVRRECADALVAPAQQVMLGRRIAYGVVTADCIPILIRTEAAWGLVHAGWRGLADGVIEETLRYLECGSRAEVVILACAGAETYEVGAEVIDALGTSAVATPGGDRGKFLLDLSATAQQRLYASVSGITVAVSKFCTISDGRFHSFRRDGDRAGRSLSFVIPS